MRDDTPVSAHQYFITFYTEDIKAEFLNFIAGHDYFEFDKIEDGRITLRLPVHSLDQHITDHKEYHQAPLPPEPEGEEGES